jgi:hypothetical protein
MSSCSIIFFGITKVFFIFGIIKDFCNAIQCTKFEHKSPDKIMRYRALFSKTRFLNDVSNFTGQKAEQPASTACLLARKCH